MLKLAGLSLRQLAFSPTPQSCDLGVRDRAGVVSIEDCSIRARAIVRYPNLPYTLRSAPNDRAPERRSNVKPRPLRLAVRALCNVRACRVRANPSNTGAACLPRR